MRIRRPYQQSPTEERSVKYDLAVSDMIYLLPPSLTTASVLTESICPDVVTSTCHIRALYSALGTCQSRRVSTKPSTPQRVGRFVSFSVSTGTVTVNFGSRYRNTCDRLFISERAVSRSAELCDDLDPIDTVPIHGGESVRNLREGQLAGYELAGIDPGRLDEIEESVVVGRRHPA